LNSTEIYKIKNWIDANCSPPNGQRAVTYPVFCKIRKEFSDEFQSKL